MRFLTGLLFVVLVMPAWASAASMLDASRPEFAQTRYPLVAAAVAEIPENKTRTVEELAGQLSAITYGDGEKAFAIFRWITTHIRYDAERLRKGIKRNLTAPEVLETRQAVCGGYSALFQALAEAMKLNAHRVIGQAKGYGEDTLSHGWNAVEVDGRWVLIDPTWGSGYLDEQQKFIRHYNGYYFMAPPGELIYSHFPNNQNWQLLATPVTLDNFKQSARLYPRFFALGLGLQRMSFSGDASRLIVQFSNAWHARLSAQISVDGKQVRGNWVLSASDEDTTTLSIRFPETGSYTLTVFGQTADGGQKYESILTQQVFAQTGSDSDFPEMMEGFLKRPGELISPLNGTLERGSQYPFSIRMPLAHKVAVIDGEQWHWLERKGEYYVGYVKPQSDEVVIAAAFAPDAKRFEYLIRYHVD